MNKPRILPSVDVVEALVSQLSAEVARGESESASSTFCENTLNFLTLLRDSPGLKVAVQGIFFGLCSDAEEARAFAEDLEDFLRSGGRPKPEHDEVNKVLDVCAGMFFLGWSARGAQDESEQLEALVDR